MARCALPSCTPNRGLELDLSHLRRVGVLQTVPLYRKYVGQADYWWNRLLDFFRFLGWVVWSALRILVLKRPEARHRHGFGEDSDSPDLLDAGEKEGKEGGSGSRRATILWHEGRWYH